MIRLKAMLPRKRSWNNPKGKERRGKRKLNLRKEERIRYVCFI